VNLDERTRAAGSMSWNGVLCLEASYGALDDRSSVLPMLELLERLRVLKFIHKDVGTDAEMEHYLRLWLEDDSVRDYYVLYLAAHGSPEGLQVSEQGTPFSLARLAAALEGGCEGCVIHVGSCSVMRQPREALDRFLATTGAQVISGYDSDIDWRQSAALDILYLGALAESTCLDEAYRKMRADELSSLVTHLGFTHHPPDMGR
jgi:alkylhydroperoxidase family enzyme